MLPTSSHLIWSRCVMLKQVLCRLACRHFLAPTPAACRPVQRAPGRRMMRARRWRSIFPSTPSTRSSTFTPRRLSAPSPTCCLRALCCSTARPTHRPIRPLLASASWRATAPPPTLALPSLPCLSRPCWAPLLCRSLCRLCRHLVCQRSPCFMSARLGSPVHQLVQSAVRCFPLRLSLQVRPLLALHLRARPPLARLRPIRHRPALRHRAHVLQPRRQCQALRPAVVRRCRLRHYRRLYCHRDHHRHVRPHLAQAPP